MYKLILLDADNTIFDYNKAEENALFKSLEHFNITENLDTIRSTYQKINSQLWKQLELGEVTKSYLRTQRFKATFDVYDFKIDPEEFSDFYLDRLGEGHFLLDGAEELCKYLSTKYRLVILTNGIKEVQDSRIKGSSVFKYLEDIVTSDEVGINKPKVGIFQWVFDKLKYTDKSSAIIIGDSLVSDIQGGVNFGIDTIWYNFTAEVNNSGLEPTYTVNSLDEIYKIL